MWVWWEQRLVGAHVHCCCAFESRGRQTRHGCEACTTTNWIAIVPGARKLTVARYRAFASSTRHTVRIHHHFVAPLVPQPSPAGQHFPCTRTSCHPDPHQPADPLPHPPLPAPPRPTLLSAMSSRCSRSSSCATARCRRASSHCSRHSSCVERVGGNLSKPTGPSSTASGALQAPPCPAPGRMPLPAAPTFSFFS